MDLISGLLGSFDFISGWLGELMHAEVMKMTLAFMIAARLHRQWVRKDMVEQFAKITNAIDNVALTMSAGFESHSSKIEGLERRVDKLEKE